ncbi:hypothetical protein BDN70DRAFT_932005 [Pholiota conissans]|uniref:Nucleolus and neural progenitor protein-like N-terminal domain-containing protein n=1 Tax=Pholiota conissans TaxID=109636 RepID=A0A9P5Z532_9AGAR|nr:hypothetical protein BDN70DRAFT_932005 [Pholiota conissans]
MSTDYIPRTLVETFRHAAIDAELKSLKLLSRRLQSNLTLLATELQLLHRLYYKNKNQHRGAIFWRNIAEVRRYLEKVTDLNLQDSIPALRNTFYGSSETSGSLKGPWTHFPSRTYLSYRAKQYEMAMKLMEKMSEVCLRAYASFHRSLQSGAFLQLLLMFVAMSSRTRAVSLDLQDTLKKVHSSTQNLLAIASVPANTQSSIGTSASSSMSLVEISEDKPLSVAEMQVDIRQPSPECVKSVKPPWAAGRTPEFCVI